MHPNHWLPLAQQRMDALHDEARRDRLARAAHPDGAGGEGRYATFRRRLTEAVGQGLAATGARRWSRFGGPQLLPR